MRRREFITLLHACGIACRPANIEFDVAGSSCAHVATSQSLRCQQTTGQRLGRFMDVARHLARWVFWIALGFEWAYIAAELAGTIQKCLPKV
jgi:hypothetical protein